MWTVLTLLHVWVEKNDFHFISLSFSATIIAFKKPRVLSRVLIVWGLRLPIARNKDKGEHSCDNQVPSLIGWKKHYKDWDLSIWLSSLTQKVKLFFTSEFAALLRLIWRGEDIFLKGKGIKVIFCCLPLNEEMFLV